MFLFNPTDTAHDIMYLIIENPYFAHAGFAIQELCRTPNPKPQSITPT